MKDGGDFLLVDLIFFRVGDSDHHLEVERHGDKKPLFDKADWLRRPPVDEGALAPLAELLRMRSCPVRWDFGVRYLDRDLPPAVCGQIKDLALIRDLGDLETKLARATSWGAELLQELKPV